MNRIEKPFDGDSRASARGSGLTHDTLSGLFWMFMGTGTHAVLQLIVLMVLARLLSPSAFGVVSMALIVVGFSSVFSQFGVGPAVVQRVDLQTRHLRTGFTLSVALGAAMTAIIWAIAPLAAAFFRMNDLASVVSVLSVVFAIQGVSVVAESLLQRKLRFRCLATIEVIAFGAGYGAVGITLALLNYGVWALVAGHLAQALLKTTALLIVQPHPKRPMIERGALGDLVYFGGGFTAARIGNYVAGQVDNLVVGRVLGASALGVYGRAHQLMAAPANFFGQILDRVLFPAMAKVQDSSEHLRLAYTRGIALIALLILPISAVVLVLAPEVVLVLLGPRWGEVTLPLQIFTAGMLLRTSYKMSDSIARSTGAVYRRAWRQAVYALLVAAGAWLGLPEGLAGVSLGVLIAIAINFLLMAHLSISLASLTWRGIWVAHVPAFALSAIVAGEAWILSSILREAHAGPALVILACLGVVSLTAVLLVRHAPERTLGPDGVWMLGTLLSYLPKRLEVSRRLGFRVW